MQLETKSVTSKVGLFSFQNINSVGNSFSGITLIISLNTDIFILTETKLETSPWKLFLAVNLCLSIFGAPACNFIKEDTPAQVFSCHNLHTFKFSGARKFPMTY